MNREKAVQLWDEKESELKIRTVEYIKNPRQKWIDPFRIFGNLYYVGDKVVSSYLVESGEGLVLFDSGFPHTAELLFERIELLGYKISDISYVIHSHEHFDHFGATYKLKQKTGCKTFIHKDAADTFRIHPHHTEIQSAYYPEAALFVPDVEFVNGTIIRLGKLNIECIHTPGHSAGAATFIFDITENKLTKRVGLCGINGNLTMHAGRLLIYGISLNMREKYLQSIENLRGLEIDITLDTHPRPNGIIDTFLTSQKNGQNNPFINPAAWQATLDDYASRMQIFLKNEKEKLSE